MMWEVKLKTHSREEILGGDLNDCLVHRSKPQLFRIVAGRRRDVHYIACCKSDECGKIAWSEDEIVRIWNYWNEIKSQIEKI